MVTEKFYYLPFGSIKAPRYPEYGYTNSERHDHIYQTYFHGIFIALLFMIITTGQVSQKFGDICYTFVIFFLNISDFIAERLLEKLSDENYEKYFLLIIIFNTVACFLCIYTLVGSRLYLIVMYPAELKNMTSQFVSSDNLGNFAAFVPLISRKRYFSVLNKFKKLKTTFTNMSSNQSMIPKSKKDNSLDSFSQSSPNHVISNMSINDHENAGPTTSFLGNNNYGEVKQFPKIGTSGYTSPTITSPIGSPQSPNRTYASNEYFNNIMNEEYNNFNKSLSRPYGNNANDVGYNENNNNVANYKFMNFDRFNYPNNRPNKNDYQQFD
jgi:hypothetical protein